MNTVRELLKDFNTENVSETILNFETKCTNARDLNDFFKGALLTSDDGLQEVSVHLEKDDGEFARLAIFQFDEDGYIISETGFDDNMEIIYVNEL